MNCPTVIFYGALVQPDRFRAVQSSAWACSTHAADPQQPAASGRERWVSQCHGVTEQMTPKEAAEIARTLRNVIFDWAWSDCHKCHMGCDSVTAGRTG